MGRAGRKSPKTVRNTSQDTTSQDAAKTTPPPPPPQDDEWYEDGDFATPKQDRYGNDDEPL
nr:hypothetical protein [Bradyrhizobium lablabi]